MFKSPNVHPIFYIACREETYRHYGDARRSFYKWVCKHEHYGHLSLDDTWGGTWCRGPSKYTFGKPYARGYPAWEATRSEARKQWQREFEVHRDQAWEKQRAIDLAAIARVERELEAKERRRLLGKKKTLNFFRLLSVGDALK